MVTGVIDYFSYGQTGHHVVGQNNVQINWLYKEKMSNAQCSPMKTFFSVSLQNSILRPSVLLFQENDLENI